MANQLSQETTDRINREAEAEYKTLSINVMAGMPASDFNRSERLAYIKGATSEANRSIELVGALQKVLDIQDDDFNIMNLTPVDLLVEINSIVTTALTNYKK